MDDPSYHRGTIDYQREDAIEEVEFYYPLDARWTCIDCGDCCGDLSDQTRMIMLLPPDIKRIEETGAKDFYEPLDSGSFIGLMCKKDRKCVFYSWENCSIYEHRALLCRMYPFWLERQEEIFIFGIDPACRGTQEGENLDMEFFAELLQNALKAMNY